MKAINFPLTQSRLGLEICLWRYGYIWLVVGFFILAALLAKFLFLPLQLRAEKAEKAEKEVISQFQSQRLNSEQPLPISALTANESAVLAQLNTVFIKQDSVSDVLRQIVRIAQQHGVNLSQSQFYMQSENSAGFRQLQVVFPIRSNYPRMRKFVEQVLIELPGVSLDRLLIRRETSAQSQAETQLRFSLWIQSEKINEVLQ